MIKKRTIAERQERLNRICKRRSAGVGGERRAEKDFL